MTSRLAIALALLAGCSGGDKGKAAESPGPQCSTCTPQGDLTFALPSPPGATLWTTTTMDKVVREAVPPKATGAAIALSAARNEFEPFQLVVRPDAEGDVTLAMPAFTGPGTIDRIEIHRVGYVRIGEPTDASSIPSGQAPDPLVATSFGAAEHVAGGANQPFWITVYVPPGAAPGDYASSLTVTVAGAAQVVPVKLHVYGFALPAAIGFDGNWNGGFQELGGGDSLAKVKELKTWFFEHRLVPSSVAWPAGLNYDGGVTFDCKTGKLTEDTGAYGVAELGAEYIDGKGWNGVGFPSFQAMHFVDNSTPRPQSFCGVDRGPDHYGTAAYNAAWSKLLAAVDQYEVDHGWAQKGYYYVQNEPQDQGDYDLAAFLADLTKTAAPHLRIAVSEQPRPEIAENPKAKGHSYDLWWADLSEFDPVYAKVRQTAGDTVWWYFLYGDQPPRFNPTTIDHPGVESRIAFWAAYFYRVKGFAYYSLSGWGADPYSNPKPQGTRQNGDGFLYYPPIGGKLTTSIRWELLREGEEDYEYLLLANGGKSPKTPGDAAVCDATVASAVSSTTSYTRDASALKHLRDDLGDYLDGKRKDCPLLQSKLPGAHKRGAYYINFQDPAGQPAQSPLVVNGHTWIKIGWSAYDAMQGFGWSGENIGKPDIMKYQYLADAPVDELQKSIIYDDYGRTDTFVWDIENGKYDVTVSIGWAGKTYSKNKVVVEGKPLFDSVETNPKTPYLVKKITVDVGDGNVTLEAGQKDEYTMLNWLSIEPVP